MLVGALFCGVASWAAHGPEKRTLIAVFPENFPPVYRVTGNNVPTGFGIEVMEELAARAGLHIVYRPVRTWEETIAAVLRGHADLIPNLGITPERRKDFDFSLPLMRIPVSVYVRAETRDIDDLDDLIRTGRTIASVETNVAYDLMRERTDIPLQRYDTLSEAFVALYTGQVDALVYPDAVIEQFARRLDLSHRIRRLGPPLAVIERAVAVRKGNSALLALLNREIETFTGTPRFQDIQNRWFGAPPPFWTTARVAYLIAGLLTFVLAIGVYARLHLLRRANAFNSAVLNTAVEGILTFDAEGRVRSANPAAERIFRRNQAEFRNMTIRDLLTDIEAEQLHRHLHPPQRPSPAGTNHAWHSMGRRPDDDPFPIHLGIAPTTVGGESLFVCTVHDLTEQRRAEREAEFLADHDPVTGLLNQHGILLVLTNLVEQARLHQRPLACLNLGIEHFEQINEMYGRRLGDAVLIQVGEFLRNTMHGTDFVSHEEETLVARVGGSRFLIVLPETGEADARAMSEKLLAGLARLSHAVRSESELATDQTAGRMREASTASVSSRGPADVQDAQMPRRPGMAGSGLDPIGGTLRLTGKIGVVCYPVHGSSAEELVSRAETTLRQAQQHPLDAILVFNPELREQDTQTHYLLQRLHAAIDERRLILHFQPVLELAGNTVRHYEALVRIENADGTLIPPGEFIPAAEKSGLITRIDYRVLELAISHLTGLEAAGRDITLAVNISGEHLGDDALFRWLARIFEEGGVTPGRLLFEITETTAVRNLLRARAFMEPLKALGCRFALDDFGVGFTTFAHLRNLPVDMIKIDGSFVRDLPTNPENHALVKAMTEAAHSLGKQVTAEYTESAMVLAALRDLGVDYAQGYYIGRPGPELAEVNVPGVLRRPDKIA